MAKTKNGPTKGLAFTDATEKELAAARSIIADHKRHRYYVGRIYTLFNKVTGKNDAAQNCASCLRTRAKAIEAWYNEGTKATAPKATKTGGVKVTNDPKPVTPPAVEAGVEVVLADDTPIIFGAPELLDGAKGIATTLDGKKVKAGTYETKHGHLIKVAVGGKATFSEVEDLT